MDSSPDASPWVTALSTYSSTREKILEHRFVADVTAELWRRAIFDFAVSHSEVDNSGYDLIVEAAGVTRHVQLKAMRLAGKRNGFDLQLRLGDKPSGCAVLMVHDPVSLEIVGYRIFAAAPGAPLPTLGERVVRHTRGSKAERPALREVPLKLFTPVTDTAELVDRLFGPSEQSLGT